jgi:uncharacterized protein (TIGR03435 family)
MPRLFPAAMLTAACVCTALAQPGPVFDAASIRPSDTPAGKGLASLREDITISPGGLNMKNVTLITAVRWAYKLAVYEISAPDSLNNDRYDIVAKSAGPATEDQLRLMLRALLTERCMLAFHRQPKELSAFVLAQGKDPVKLQSGEGGGEGSMTGAGLVFQGHKMPLSRLADIVSSAIKLPVLDKTGLDGVYDFTLDLRPYLAARQAGDGPLDITDIATSALKDELGIRLESRKVQMDVLVVDRAEKPAAN